MRNIRIIATAAIFVAVSLILLILYGATSANRTSDFIPEVQLGHSGQLTAIDENPEADSIATGDANGQIVIWAEPFLRRVGAMKTYSKILRLRFIGNRRLLSVDISGTVNLWDYQTDKVVSRFSAIAGQSVTNGQTGWVGRYNSLGPSGSSSPWPESWRETQLAISRSAKLLAALQAFREDSPLSIAIFGLPSGNVIEVIPIAQPEPYRHSVYGMAVSPDEAALAISVDGILSVIDLTTRQKRCGTAASGSFRLAPDPYVESVEFSPGGDMLILSVTGKSLIADAYSCQILQTIPCSEDLCTSRPRFSASGLYFTRDVRAGVEIWKRVNQKYQYQTLLDNSSDRAPYSNFGPPYFVSEDEKRLVWGGSRVKIRGFPNGGLYAESRNPHPIQISYARLRNHILTFETVAEDGTRQITATDLTGAGSGTSSSAVLGASNDKSYPANTKQVAGVAKSGYILSNGDLQSGDRSIHLFEHLPYSVAETIVNSGSTFELSNDENVIAYRHWAFVDSSSRVLSRWIWTTIDLTNGKSCDIRPTDADAFRSYDAIGIFGPTSAKWINITTDKTLQLWDLNKCEVDWSMPTPIDANQLTALILSGDGRIVIGTDVDRRLIGWDLQAKSLHSFSLVLRDMAKSVTVDQASGDFVFSLEDNSIVIAKLDEMRQLYEICSGFWSNQGDWVFIGPSGAFDTRSIEELSLLELVFRDQPLIPVAPEIFMRDYYEPRLLPRLLDNDPSLRKPSQGLASLNRTQPYVSEPEVQSEPGHPELVTVRVRLKSVSSQVQKDAQGRPRKSGIYDLRLFRGGQLVRWAPRSSTEWQAQLHERGNDLDGVDLRNWRNANEITGKSAEVERVAPDGTIVVRFEHVPLSRRAGQKEVEWRAYAFNDDRVKSATTTKTIELPRGVVPRQGKAYVISIGVNRTQSVQGAWDLQYAANDARRMTTEVTERLNNAKVGETKQFASVVPIRLVSDAGAQREGELPATQAYLHAVLDVLAGKTVPELLRSQLQKLGLQEKGQPEDLVLLSISSHGYTDQRGTFHFVLADVTESQRVTQTLDRQTLSSDQLSAWLREVDAGELVLIVDACQSETTIQTEGFKPGPMGSRGLGQLAYDKGMRVLAASKAKESAFELGQDAQGHKIDQGLLSYALVQEGLVEKQADTDHDGRITMGEWLRYAELEVPKLFQQGYARGGVEPKSAPAGTKHVYLGARQGDVGNGPDTPARYQQPTLFDFNKTQRETIIIGK